MKTQNITIFSNKRKQNNKTKNIIKQSKNVQKNNNNQHYNKIKNFELYCHNYLKKEYQTTPNIYYKNQINNFIKGKFCHSLASFKDKLLYFNFSEDFLKRFYSKIESNKKLPLFFDFYKAYLNFFCKPTFADISLNELMKQVCDNKAKLFYNNNYKEQIPDTSKKTINPIIFSQGIRKELSRKSTFKDLSKTTIFNNSITNKSSINSLNSIYNLLNDVKKIDSKPLSPINEMNRKRKTTKKISFNFSNNKNNKNIINNSSSNNNNINNNNIQKEQTKKLIIDLDNIKNKIKNNSKNMNNINLIKNINTKKQITNKTSKEKKNEYFLHEESKKSNYINNLKKNNPNENSVKRKIKQGNSSEQKNYIMSLSGTQKIIEKSKTRIKNMKKKFSGNMATKNNNQQKKLYREYRLSETSSSPKNHVNTTGFPHILKQNCKKQTIKINIAITDTDVICKKNDQYKNIKRITLKKQ